MNSKVYVSITLILALVLSGILLELDEGFGAAKLTLTAVKVQKAPAGLDDPVWKKARAIQIPLEGKDKFAGKKKTVTTKAIYTYEDIYFLFSWKDPTRSVSKKTWQFNGKK